MFYLLTLITKYKTRLIRKTAIFAYDRFHMHCGIDKFCITCMKLITTIELACLVNLRANFNLNKFEKLLIWFDRQNKIKIQLFINVMQQKQSSNYFQSYECFICAKIWLFPKLMLTYERRKESCKFYIS